jgi:hypothetical protein
MMDSCVHVRQSVPSRIVRALVVPASVLAIVVSISDHITGAGREVFGPRAGALVRQKVSPSPPRYQDFTAAATAAIAIYPGDDIQSQVDASAAGSTFLLKTGIHRMQTIRPRSGDIFTGEAGTILSGARVLTDFVRSGDYWVARGQTQQGPHDYGSCQTGVARCTFPEQLYFDSEFLEHVGSLASVGPGKWYFDYDADAIYFWDDPTVHRVETSVTPTAFEPTGDQVTITNLTIEKFANPAQQGAIHGQGRTGWTVTSNEVRWNHGTGIRIGGGSVVRQNYVNSNGQLGIFATGADVTIENNEIYNNNTARYFARWEGGGAKFVETTNLIVRGNYSHRNNGPGLWTDIDNVNALIEYNTSNDNAMMGIYHEISYAAVIRYNTVRRNGFGYPDWIAGAGILIAASPNVEVYGNLVDGNADGIGAAQQNRGVGAFGPHEVWNLWVHDNVITNTLGWTGVVEDVGDSACFTSRNNRFERNQYQLNLKALNFTWMDHEMSVVEWTAYGQDLGSVFDRVP